MTEELKFLGSHLTPLAMFELGYACGKKYSEVDLEIIPAVTTKLKWGKGQGVGGVGLIIKGTLEQPDSRREAELKVIELAKVIAKQSTAIGFLRLQEALTRLESEAPNG